MDHRFFGSMSTPDGRVLHYLTDGSGVATASPGEALSTGWRVESMDTAEIRLVHPAGGESSVIPIPPPPRP